MYYLNVKPHTRATIELDIICGPNESEENIAACAREMLSEIRPWDIDDVPFTYNGSRTYGNLLNLAKELPDYAFAHDIEFNHNRLNNILIRTNVIEHDHLGNKIIRPGYMPGKSAPSILEEDEQRKLKWVRFRNCIPFTKKYRFTAPSLCYIRNASLYYAYLEAKHPERCYSHTGSSPVTHKTPDNSHYDTSTTVIHSHDISMF